MNTFGRISLTVFSFSFLAGVIFVNIFATTVQAEVLVPPTAGNQLTVEVQPQVTQDPNTQIYTYNYTVSNLPASLQEMWLFAIELAPGTTILSSSAPSGWRFAVHTDQPLASWAAVDIPALPPGYVDDGNLVPSPYNLKPGETNSSFSFQTFAPPADGQFYAQGFRKLPQVSGDAEEIADAGYVIPPLTQDSFNGITTTPNLLPYGGGRRPAIDGFLVFLNIQKSGNVFVSPVTIAVKFSFNGETVSRQSFSATLNRIDVTDQFVPDTTYGGDLVAQFTLLGSPMVVGRNVLITSVDGTVPDTTRIATDVDRVIFELQN